MGQQASYCRTSTARTPNTTIQVNQLNESLFELHKPKEQRSMVVLLFHGFQFGNYENAHLSTWQSGDESSIWPQTWLVDDNKYPDAHIFSIAYTASLLKTDTGGRFDLYIIAENIISDLLETTVGAEQNCPIVLVGHSFGGLVVKELCFQAHKKGSMGSSKHQNFLENIKGIFFYATPHHGISREVSEYFVSKQNQSLLEYVDILSKSAARLHEDFGRLQRQWSWNIAGVGEGSPTELSTSGTKVIVPEGSSRYGDSFVIVENADHISICRPISNISTSFNSLCNFLRGIPTTWKRPVRPQNHQSLPKSGIGLDNVIKELKWKLEKVPSLGLAGMGGIGKTTTLKALFNDMEHLFEHTCFVGDVKNIKHRMEDVVLNQMHYRGMSLARKDGGLEFLEGKQVFLVLDDVASENHMAVVSSLIYDIHVREDSRFVVTSRDSELLNRCLEEVHPIQLFGQKFAKRLFLAHAFRQVDVSPELEEYIDIVVRKCGGLALTLEVIGKYLYKKPVVIWKEAITILDNAETVLGFDEKLWSRLRLSFDGLEVEEKHMFLDCATRFYRRPLVEAKYAWNITTGGLQESLWQHLLDLSLVWEVKDMYGVKCGMHDQLLSLGKRIASNLGDSGLRLWDEDLKAFLRIESFSEDELQGMVALNIDGSVEGVNETFTPIGSRSIEGSTLCKMQRLRYLALKKCTIDTKRNELPCSLVSLEMQSVEFSELPFRPSDHSRIAILKMYNCEGMRTLPSTFGHLSSLQDLRIYDIPLKSLPDSLGSLARLKHLHLESCRFLVELPETFGQLTALEKLNICDCESLSDLPKSFGYLPRLKSLYIWGCSCLRYLPDSFLHLQGLESLYLHKTSLRIIPNLENLRSLKDLEVHQPGIEISSLADWLRRGPVQVEIGALGGK